MDSSQQFCLKWNNHQSNLISVFDDLLSNQDYVDVTLACEGHNIKAHKMVLSACSPFFQDLFKNNPCKHPIVIMKDMKYTDMKAIVKFMYKGEVNVSQDKLSTLLKTAESLQIKGLAEVANENEQAAETSRQEPTDSNANYRPAPTNQSTHQPHPSPTAKRRKRRNSNESSSAAIESTNSLSNSEVNVPSSRLSSSQYQQSTSTPTHQPRSLPDPQPTRPPSSSSTPVFSEIKLKSEVIDEPDIIPIPIEHEISRVKSSPVEPVHDTDETSYDASYSMMEQNVRDIASNQDFVTADSSFATQMSESSNQGAQPDDNILSQGGEVQYQDDVGGDLALSYMESGNTNMSDELSPGPSSLPQDGSADARGSGRCGAVRTSVCPYCQKTFTQRSSMYRHMKCVHAAGGSFSCPVCFKKFKGKPYLDQHLDKTHKLQKRHRCKVCNRSFNLVVHLLRHEALHQNESK